MYSIKSPVLIPCTIGDFHTVYRTIRQISKGVSKGIICIFRHFNSSRAPRLISTHQLRSTRNIILSIRVWCWRIGIAAVLSRTNIEHIVLIFQLDIKIIRTSSITNHMVRILGKFLIFTIRINCTHP